MQIVSLDLEGVLVPEIWIGLAESTGIAALKRTTRDEPNYSLLMTERLKILRDHGITIHDVQKVILAMEPLEGAKNFLDQLRQKRQVIILSDTFRQFAHPLMERLGWPTLFCNDLIIDDQGNIQDFVLRQEDGKRMAVKAFQSMNCTVCACGDSYNDITMLQQAERACFFRPPESIRKEQKAFSAFTSYNDVLNFILTME